MRNMNDPKMSGTLPSVEGIVSIHSRNLTLFAHIDHSGEARRVGLTMQEAHVLIFGNPKGGTPLMIASPLLHLICPLKSLSGRVWMIRSG